MTNGLRRGNDSWTLVITDRHASIRPGPDGRPLSRRQTTVISKGKPLITWRPVNEPGGEAILYEADPSLDTVGEMQVD